MNGTGAMSSAQGGRTPNPRLERTAEKRGRSTEGRWAVFTASCKESPFGMIEMWMSIPKEKGVYACTKSILRRQRRIYLI